MQRGIYQGPQPVRRKVAGVRAGSTLSKKHAHANALGARLFQRLGITQAHRGRELAAIHSHSLGSSRAALHGLTHHIYRDLFQISRCHLRAHRTFLRRNVHATPKKYE